MREINQDIVKQVPDEPRRRWFEDDFFDLLIWENSAGRIVGFQLCYDKLHNQHALTWNENKGFIHNKIDDGENNPGKYKSTPLLTPDGTFYYLSIAEKFKIKSFDIDAEVSAFVYEKVRDYC
jgi:hypothetical protein